VADALRDASFDEIILSRLPPGTSQSLVEGLPNHLAARPACRLRTSSLKPN
jgi:hypothetical protein